MIYATIETLHKIKYLQPFYNFIVLLWHMVGFGMIFYNFIKE